MQYAYSDAAVRDETAVPGAVVEVIERNGVLWERNGAGSVVAYVYPHGLEAPEETPADRVERLAAELRAARKALKAVGGAR